MSDDAISLLSRLRHLTTLDCILDFELASVITSWNRNAKSMGDWRKLQDMLSQYQLPFVLHLLVEIPASINFLLAPAFQLERSDTNGRAVIRQYATLLLSMNIIATIFVFRAADKTTGDVAGAMAVYHVAPTARALYTILRGGPGVRREAHALGGPIIHLIVHITCLGFLFKLFLTNI